VEKMPTTNNIRENTRSLWRHLSVLGSVLAPIRDRYDYILVDSHPDINNLLRTILSVNTDAESVAKTFGEETDYSLTQYAGAIATQAREWRRNLKRTEHTEYWRISQAGPIFEVYVMEGDRLRQAARDLFGLRHQRSKRRKAVKATPRTDRGVY